MNRFAAGASLLFGHLGLAGILLAATAPGIRAGQSAPDAQAAQPPLSDTRLTVHTLLREDIFAGFLADDMTRFARGEKNIDLLLERRPDQKANLLAWKGGALLYRAVRASEQNRSAEFQRLYRQGTELLAQSSKLTTGNDGVLAVVGGSNVIFAERLPKAKRAAAWEQAYNAYHALVKQQDAALDKLPVHFRGELLAGLAVSAARTGHAEEAMQVVNRMLANLQDTPYEPEIKRWKANPGATPGSGLTCMSCHEPGRLAARLKTLDAK